MDVGGIDEGGRIGGEIGGCEMWLGGLNEDGMYGVGIEGCER